MSLSARRAWIEIGSADYVQYNYNVALRKESVDRNPLSLSSLQRLLMSLSARRAWIEIGDKIKKNRPRGGRSPQGERG